MATIKFDGIEKYIQQLNQIGNQSVPIIKMAVYDGADIVADAIRSNLNSALSTAPLNVQRRDGDLARSLNLNSMKNEDGFIYTKISWVGYDGDGTPNAIKAAVLEAGRSDQQRRKTGFIRKAVSSSQHQAEIAMADTFDREIKKIIKE